MTLKELNQAFWLQQEIAGLSRQLEEMRERASTIPSAGFDNMPHGSGPKISRTEKQVVEIVELESRLNEQKTAPDGSGNGPADTSTLWKMQNCGTSAVYAFSKASHGKRSAME